MTKTRRRRWKKHNPGTDGWIGIAVYSSFPLRVFAGPGQHAECSKRSRHCIQHDSLAVAPSRSINHTRPHKAGYDDDSLTTFRRQAQRRTVSTPSFLFLLTRYGLRTSCVRYAPLPIHPCVCVCLCAPSPRPVRAQSYRSRSTLLGLAVVPPNQPVSPF